MPDRFPPRIIVLSAATTGVALTLLSALVGGCQSTGAPSASGSESGATAAPAVSLPKDAGGASAAAATAPAAAMPRKVIYTSEVEMTVERMDGVIEKLNKQVKDAGGYVSASRVEGQGNSAGSPRTATCTVRIPVERFDAFLKALGSLGEIGSSHTTSQDVSEEFYDLEARLRNKRAEEARLIQHLQRSTTKLSDILEVEAAISRVREEIERMEGRRRFLANQSDLATVTVTVHEAVAFPQRIGTPSLATQARRTFAGSLGALGDFARGLTLVVVALAPWAAVGAGIGIPIWRLSIRRRRKNSQKTTEQRTGES